MLTNARSLLRKLDETSALISSHRPDLFCVTETWLPEDIRDSEVNIHGYQQPHTSRQGNSHGGVFIYLSSAWNILQTHHLHDPDNLVEALHCRIKSGTGPTIDILLLYRSPSSVDRRWMSWVRDVSSKPNYIILGDFNVHAINWET